MFSSDIEALREHPNRIERETKNFKVQRTETIAHLVNSTPSIVC